MELLYVWIEESSNGFIKKQGFNFSREHRFWLEEKDNEYTLKYEKVASPPPNLYKDTNIQNITAIVGENGSGKSTILSELLSFNMARQRSKNKSIDNTLTSIRVFCDNDEIIIYDNLANNKLKLNLHINHTHCSVNTIAQIARTSLEVKYADSQSKIYFSNSSYGGYGSYSNDANIFTKVGLSNSAMQLYSKLFFRKLLGLKGITTKNQNFLKLSQFIYDDVKVNDLQNICDVLYYIELHIKLGSNQNVIKKCNKISINFNSSILFKTYLSNSDICQSKLSHINNLKDILDNSDKSLEECFIYNLYINLIVEAILFLDFEPKYTELSIPKLYLDTISFINSCDSDLIKYYQEALSEIASLEKILQLTRNDYATSSFTNVFKKDLSICNNEQQFWAFCDFIKKYATSPYSFTLKYLNIEEFKMSSGERAMQNLFSRLNILSFFHNLLQVKYASLCGDILLLIDEIDLYMHPEWQRKSMSYLVEELALQFPKHKIQIILTTHSPFVLSDLPKENIIYLKPKNDEFNIEKHTENTFGANIHTLLKDSFFMDSTIGEFARQKIQEVNEKLDSGTFDYEETLALIDIIGEPIIKNYLLDKLNEKSDRKSDKEIIKEKDREIAELKQQLEARNDKN